MPSAPSHAAAGVPGKGAGTLVLAGDLTFATAARAYRDAARALAAGRQELLDLRPLARVDSAGLACVLALAAEASRAGRPLRVLGMPADLRALAAVCDVESMLEPAAAAG